MRSDIAKYKDVRTKTGADWSWGHDAGSLRLWPATGACELAIDDFGAIRDATAADLPIVAQTEIKHPTSGLRAVIEYPVKTMNILRTDTMADTPPQPVAAGVWQTDTGAYIESEPPLHCKGRGLKYTGESEQTRPRRTNVYMYCLTGMPTGFHSGPLLVPDLSRRFEPAIDAMSLGFVAANNRQIEAADFVLEQPTSIGGGREVLHYSKPFSMPAINRLFALPLPAH